MKLHDIFTQKKPMLCSVFNLQLFVGGLKSYLRYLCLLTHSGVQHILCCVFRYFVFVLCTLCMSPISLDCSFLIAHSVVSSVYYLSRLPKPCDFGFSNIYMHGLVLI